MKQTSVFLHISAFVILFCCAQAAEPIDLVVVAGQSNGVGFDADPSWLHPDPVDKEILFWWRCGDPPPDGHDSTSRGTWTYMQAQYRGDPLPFDSDKRQFGNFAHAQGGFGPEVGLARTLAVESNTKIAVVKVAFSGTSLDGDYNSRDLGRSGACYRSLVEEINQAIRSLRSKGFAPRVRAIAWVQGESDCRAVEAERYRDRLETIIVDLRKDLGSPSAYFVAGFNTMINGADNPFTHQVVAAQRSIAQEIPHCLYVDTAGLSLANRYHYDAPGIFALGCRFARALIAAENSAQSITTRPSPAIESKAKSNQHEI